MKKLYQTMKLFLILAMLKMILRKLIAFQQDKNTRKVTANNRKFFHFKYCYNNNILICHSTYQVLVGVGHSYLDNIIKYLREYGLKEHIHGNIGNAPKNMNCVEVNYDIACEIYNFLQNYFNIHGLPSPGRKLNKITMLKVFLLTDCSYASVYHYYVQAFKEEYEEEKHMICESTFRNIWRSLMPSLQFMSPKSDLCETCKTMKLELQYIIEYEKKISATENYLAHL